MLDRATPRRRTLLGGQIHFNSNSSTIDCVIRDMSEGGARLVVENGLSIPDRFTLKVSDGRSFECQIRWRKMTLIGVAFVGE